MTRARCALIGVHIEAAAIHPEEHGDLLQHARERRVDRAGRGVDQPGREDVSNRRRSSSTDVARRPAEPRRGLRSPTL